jgi:hypothetical protein
MPNLVMIGQRVRLARGMFCGSNKPAQLDYMAWMGGNVRVGEQGVIALAGKTPNQLATERAHMRQFPDTACVIWDQRGAVKIEDLRQDREAAESVYVFAINAGFGDPLPEFLEPVDAVLSAPETPMASGSTSAVAGILGG